MSKRECGNEAQEDDEALEAFGADLVLGRFARVAIRFRSDGSGDNLYGPRICWQAFIDWAWDAFDFDHDDWDEGFGYDEVCNNTQPLSRALSGIWCLTYSSPRFPSESYNGNILEWGYRFARNAIDELGARCGTSSCTPSSCPGSIAYSQWGPGTDDLTRLYLPFFTTKASASEQAQ